jgi:hypothetical protein
MIIVSDNAEAVWFYAGAIDPKSVNSVFKTIDLKNIVLPQILLKRQERLRHSSQFSVTVIINYFLI